MAAQTSEEEAKYLRERAARLRKVAKSAMPASISDKLLELAADLEKRADRLERARRR